MLGMEATDGNGVGPIQFFIDEQIVTVGVEVTPAPLVDLLDTSILIENLPMRMDGEKINVDVMLQKSSHLTTEPNYDVEHVVVERAKASSTYTDEDIENIVKNDWNGTAAA